MLWSNRRKMTAVLFMMFSILLIAPIVSAKPKGFHGSQNGFNTTCRNPSDIESNIGSIKGNIQVFKSHGRGGPMQMSFACSGSKASNISGSSCQSHNKGNGNCDLFTKRNCDFSYSVKPVSKDIVVHAAPNRNLNNWRCGFINNKSDKGRFALASGDAFSAAAPQLETLCCTVEAHNPTGAKGPNSKFGRHHCKKRCSNPDSGNDNLCNSSSENKYDTDNVDESFDIDAAISPKAAPLYHKPELEFSGCPALLNWTSAELGLPKGQLQIYFAKSLAWPTVIQPCELCARLQTAALILSDVRQHRINSLKTIFAAQTGIDAPLSPEQISIIATSLLQSEEGTDYSNATEYIEAARTYVRILTSEFGYKIEDSIGMVSQYIDNIDSETVKNFVWLQIGQI